MIFEGATLEKLAELAGLLIEWKDAAGSSKKVPPEVLRRVLDKMGLPAGSVSEVRESIECLADARGTCPALVTADEHQPVVLPAAVKQARARLFLEDGSSRDVSLEQHDGRRVLPAIPQPGYHVLHFTDGTLTLAVAPRTCYRETGGARLWGMVAQLYGLRRSGDGGIGDTTAVSAFAKTAAKFGADALALSPTAALFSGDPTKFSPYSPSSRLFLNPLLGDPAVLFGPDRVAQSVAELGLTEKRLSLETAELIDWPAAATCKLAVLRHLFDVFSNRQDEELTADFEQFRRNGGQLLERHAQFETLFAIQRPIDPARGDWRAWPAQFQDPESAAVANLCREKQSEVAFHAFLQWMAQRSLASAHADARKAGMRIGLIADLAVGMEGGGSHAWSRQNDVLVGLNIGAPPDLLNPRGQNWGLTTFSPRTLGPSGFASFLATLRATMRHAGGVRIDHAMGLRRLWIIPDGAAPGEGAYLTYPFHDLLRLVRLESYRHRAMVIAEDLGTVPEGFHKDLADAGIAGMDVLWFLRRKGRFLAPPRWRRDAVAMTTTHDLPTVSGWWRGADIELREKHNLLAEGSAPALRAERAGDREQLWRVFQRAGAASPANSEPANLDPVVDAALSFVAATPSRLALIPLEDMLGMVEQPNLPGTISEHPNWRRRYPMPVTESFAAPTMANRADILNRRKMS